MSTDDAAALARSWLRSSSTATLCTLSTAAGLEGFPFGSIVPYALDERGRPLLLLAEIAEHTKNAADDARASVFVAEAGRSGDPQAGWRLNLAGTLTRLQTKTQTPKRAAARGEVIDDDAHERLLARYLERVPGAVASLATHDFFLWRLDVLRVRNIAGFGRIYWVDGQDMVIDDAVEGADAAVAHMNADHAGALKEMCLAFAGVTPALATLEHIDAAGMFVRTTAPDQLLRFSFDDVVDGSGVRQAVIAVLQQARRALASAAARATERG
jgi:putative heme iron utilization protein